MFAACVVLLASAHEPQRLQPVPFTQVRVEDRFWSPRQEVNRTVSLPHSLDMLEKAGNIRNLELAASGARTGYTGPVFMDSDLYKVLEAAALSLATHPDPKLEKRLDGIVAKIAAAQMPDGYLDTWYQVNEPTRRFTNLRDNHELYCAGHLFEAAVAHFQATGKRTLLSVAAKYADLLDRTFGPGKRMGYCGHPEVELALIKLWKATGERRYYKLAEFFIGNRGSKFFAAEHNTPQERYDGTYWLDQVPIRDQTTMVGHAVRAGYLMSGATDVMSEDADPGLMAMVDRVWENTTGKRMYVTGGIGPSGSNEGFTTDYDLPNLTAYQETCASVAMAMWNQRLAMLYGESRYADLVELALYNGILAGGSLDGKRYFYVNPLASRGGHHRQGWFSCACCPPNESRTLASVGGYAYATSPGTLWVNQFIAGSVHSPVTDLRVQTEYPWEGKAVFTIQKAGTFDVRLRHPAWSQKVDATMNGRPLPWREDRGYVVLHRAWKKGDSFTYWMTMPVRRIQASPLVREDRGRLALARGPLVYCLEGVDNAGRALDLSIPADSPLRFRPEPILGGIITIVGTGYRRASADWSSGLYGSVAEPRPVSIKAVPYYAWDNREPGEMQVWIPTAPEPPKVATVAGAAKVTMSFRNSNADPGGVNDGTEPLSSSEQPERLCHFWPHKGGREWIQYDWPAPRSLAGARVYFFDDTGRGECRYPKEWWLEALDGGEWKPVKATGPYETRGDRWCEVHFQPLKAKAMRLVVRQQDGWSTGIRQWQLISAD